MAIAINGVNYSYDYEELLKDIDCELAEGCLNINSHIQVLRSDEVAFGDYRPIVDYYYNNEKMQEIITIDFDDDIDEIKEKKDIEAQYLEVKNKLENMLILDVINEMKKVLSVID